MTDNTLKNDLQARAQKIQAIQKDYQSKMAQLFKDYKNKLRQTVKGVEQRRIQQILDEIKR